MAGSSLRGVWPCYKHHRGSQSRAPGAVGDLCVPQEQVFLRGTLSSTSPCPPHPPCSLLASPVCHLAWDQSSLVCSQGTRFFPSSQTQGQTICLGLLKHHSRIQALNPCLGGEPLRAGWEQGPVGRVWVLWFTHQPGGQCRDINNSSQRKAAATSVLVLRPLFLGRSGNPILLP